MKGRNIKKDVLKESEEGPKRESHLSTSSYPILPPARKSKMLCLPPGKHKNYDVTLKADSLSSSLEDMAHNLPIDESELLVIIKPTMMIRINEKHIVGHVRWEVK